jgi:hypothetical protein
VGDGMVYDTLAIQAAIDACAQNKEGGVVVFEEQKQYLSAQLLVHDGVLLRVPKTTSLLAGSKVGPRALQEHSFTPCGPCAGLRTPFALLKRRLAAVLLCNGGNFPCRNFASSRMPLCGIQVMRKTAAVISCNHHLGWREHILSTRLRQC